MIGGDATPKPTAPPGCILPNLIYLRDKLVDVGREMASEVGIIDRPGGMSDTANSSVPLPEYKHQRDVCLFVG